MTSKTYMQTLSYQRSNQHTPQQSRFVSLPKFALNKRHKIVIAAVLLSLAFLLVTQNANVYLKRYYFIFGFAVLTYLVSVWALREGLTKTKAVVLMILPTMFALGTASFYFTFREIRWLTRLPVALLFGMLTYTMILSQNVFNVASERTIPLYRAASTASFIFTLFSAFMIFSVISTFELDFYWNALLVAVISFPLILQYIWTMEMAGINRLNFTFTLVHSLTTAEIAMGLSFWPLNPIIWSLLLTVVLYINLGITSDYYRKKLTGRGVLEYLTVGVFVLLISFLAASWNG